MSRIGRRRSSSSGNNSGGGSRPRRSIPLAIAGNASGGGTATTYRMDHQDASYTSQEP